MIFIDQYRPCGFTGPAIKHYLGRLGKFLVYPQQEKIEQMIPPEGFTGGPNSNEIHTQRASIATWYRLWPGIEVDQPVPANSFPVHADEKLVSRQPGGKTIWMIGKGDQDSSSCDFRQSDGHVETRAVFAKPANKGTLDSWAWQLLIFFMHAVSIYGETDSL